MWGATFATHNCYGIADPHVELYTHATISVWWDTTWSIGARGVERVLGGEQMGQGFDRSVRETLGMFADELSAHRYLEKLLWPNGVCCPRCRSIARVGKLEGATTRLGTYKCYSCRKPFSLLHGTVMSASHVPAHKWLQAIYLTEGGARPMRPFHLHKILNVSLKTASSMMRRLAEAAGEAPSPCLHFPALVERDASTLPHRGQANPERARP